MLQEEHIRTFICVFLCFERKKIKLFWYFAAGLTHAPIFTAMSVIGEGAPRCAGLDNGALVCHVAMYHNLLLASPCKQDLKTLSTKSIKNLYSFFSDV